MAAGWLEKQQSGERERERKRLRQCQQRSDQQKLRQLAVSDAIGGPLALCCLSESYGGGMAITERV